MERDDLNKHLDDIENNEENCHVMMVIKRGKIKKILKRTVLEFDRNNEM